MEKTSFEFDKNMLEVTISQDYIKFLGELSLKQEKINKELTDLGIKKEKIINKISESKKAIEHEPKELREYINNAEYALESIEIVYKNLSELQNNYRSIEKSLVLISEKRKLNIDNNEINGEIKVLLQKIEFVKSYEERIKVDNEKNYLIINSSIEKTPNYNLNVDKTVGFESLTLENLQDNSVLKICENRVELPYTKKEIEQFMQNYPNEYKTVQDVIVKEFMMNISMFNKHPILSRFREAYYLCRNKEMMSILDSFNFAKGIMFRSEINPYIIAAVKSKKQFEDYIKCLEENKLDDYPHFKIVFEINPLAV